MMARVSIRSNIEARYSSLDNSAAGGSVMKPVCRVFVFSSFALVLAYPLSLSAQWNKKPYTEWSEKEATKLLNDSPWCQTQAVTDTSRQSSTQTSGSGSVTAIAEVVNVNFRVRFLSAKSTRQAFARMMELQQKGKLPEDVAARLKAFAAADFPDYIVVTVSAESDKPSNMLQQANATLYKLTTNELKNVCYLMVDGKRVFLREYQPPGKDGLGARLIFPRLVDGEPFVSQKSGDILFHAELGGRSALDATVPNTAIPNRDLPNSTANRTATPFGFTISTRYKVKDMMFEGKLEY